MNNMMNDVKELVEVLKNQTVEEIEEFRKEWIEGLDVDKRFLEINIAMVNNVCDKAIHKKKVTA